MAGVRRSTTGAAVLGFAAAALWWAHSASGQVAQIQIQPGGPVVVGPGGVVAKKKDDKGTRTSQFSALKLIENADFRRYINVARDAIKDKDWAPAVTALQAILDTKEDSYVQIRETDASGAEVLRWTSVKFAATQLLGGMPDEGLDVYEQRFGGRALAMLKEAKETGNSEQLAEVAHRFFNTKAGAEANERLATMLLDRSQYFLAALRFERMLRLSERFGVGELTYFKAALSYRRAGDAVNADKTWKAFEKRLGGRAALPTGSGTTVSVATLRAYFENDTAPLPVGLFDWPMIRGNLANNAQANGSPPLLDQSPWSRKLLLDDDRSIDFEQAYHTVEREAKKEIDALLASATNGGGLPGFFPITANGRLVYRAYGEVRCVALKAGTHQGQNIQPGETLWRTFPMEGSLVQLLSSKELARHVRPWLNAYVNQPGFGTLLYENTLLGSLATDHQNVYAIDDLAVPPPDNNYGVANPFMGMPQQNVPADIKPLVMQNCLYAFNLQTGAAVWYLGNNSPREPGQPDEFTSSHFLGPPISVGGRLYVLNEKNTGITGDAELRLVCIDPNRVEKTRPAIAAPIQVLGMIEQRSRVTHAISRRINAVHLAYGEGILVCPTNAGEVLGVDLVSRSLAWAYPYREANPQETGISIGKGPINPGFSPLANTSITHSKWKSTPPVIVSGKVLFTAPDADSLHCVNLHDGTPRWKAGKEKNDLFFAGVVGDKAIVVGRTHTRGLSLDDGSAAWVVPNGDAPSGFGVASNDVYYLPIRRSEIVAIDTKKGVVKARNRSKFEGLAPGNLVFSDDVVLSLNPLEVNAYPQLQAKLDVAERELKQNPSDPTRLVARGEILLADGQVQRAVDDLRQALAGKLPETLEKRARVNLYEALTDLMIADFPVASAKYLDEYRQLSQLGDTDRAKQMRQARFFRIVGAGLESQGNLIEAFQAYKEFGSLAIHRETGGVASLDDPTHKVPVDVWLRGRVSAMFAKATAQQRSPLEAKIAEEWRAIQSRGDLDSLRAFAGMFDVAFSVGREARLKLADAIVARNDLSAFLEAELALLQLRGPEHVADAVSGGRALATLARLEEKKSSAGSLESAAAYYRQLAREYPDAPVREGRSGKQLLDDLAADKRLLPFLEESSAFWSQARMTATQLNQGVGMINANPAIMANRPSVVLHPEDEPSTFMRGHRLTVDVIGTSSQIKLTDLSTGTLRWGPLPLGGGPINLQFQHIYMNNQFNQGINAKLRLRQYHSVGHLVVVQVGVVVYCIDAEQGRVLWQKPLVENFQQTPNSFAQLQPGADGELTMIVHNQFNGQRITQTSIGSIGEVQANYVALVTTKGLQVMDPLRGVVLWSKTDVPPNARVFGDAQHLYVIEDPLTVNTTRVLRASDGEAVRSPQFSREWRGRLAVHGGRLLTRTEDRGQHSIRLYDIATGKDVWSTPISAAATQLQTEDPNLVGWIDPSDKLVVLNARTGEKLIETQADQGRVPADQVKGLLEPLLMADSDRFYLALNRPADNAKVQGAILNNFHSGIRSRYVNGWVLAFHRRDGVVNLGGASENVKKGDLAWHSAGPIANQMLVVEQFERMPILVFTGRYNRAQQNGGNNWVASTTALHKVTGKSLYEPQVLQPFPPNNFLAHFVDLQVDARKGVVNLIGFSYSIQFHVDDGRKAELPTGLIQTSQADMTAPPVPVGGARVINGRILIAPRIQAVPLPAPIPERE